MQLQLQMLEQHFQVWLQRLADQCVQVKACIDPATDGLWLSNGAEYHKAQTNAYRYQAVEKIEKLSYQNTQNIAKMYFSPQPHIRAEAKLNLSAVFDTGTFERIVDEPAKILAIASIQAKLTPLETLAIVFPVKDRQSEHTCIACGTAVKIGTRLFHKYCKVVEWLTTHAPFRYDQQEGYLSQERRMYLTPEQRARLVHLLELHHQLTKDIAIRHSGVTTAWSRDERGGLRRTELNRIAPEDQVGSMAWRRKYGFTK